VSNDDKVTPGGGFGTHGHRDMEIVTWVLDGVLEHRDSTGTEGVIRPGEAQRMTAGSGIMHSEMNHSQTEPVHFIQMWVPPHEANLEPGYEQLDLSDELAQGGLVAVASGRGHQGAVAINQRDAVMWVARLETGDTVTLPDAPFVHLFVPVGAAEVSAAEGPQPLATGDAVRLTDAGPATVTATEKSELIVWEMHSSL
jgi:redox-sensitive bicupin YhaK (pirin superfamily)